MAAIYYVRLEWTDNSDNEDVFDVYRGVTPDYLVKIGEAAANVTLYDDHGDNNEGLTRERTYYYQVRSRNAAGAGASEVISIRISDFAPPAVSGLQVSNDQQGSVTLTWAPSSGAVGYRVYYQEAGGPLQYVTQTAGLLALVTPVKQYTEYTFYVEAFNDFGSVETPTSLVHTTAVYQPLATGIALTVDQFDNMYMTVRVTAPYSPPYDRLVMEISINYGAWYRPANAYNTNQFNSYVRTYDVNGLPHGTVVYARVYGQMTDGHPTDPVIYAESAASNNISIQVDDTVIAPSVPLNLTASDDQPQSIVLDWDAPATGTPSAYEIYWQEEGVNPPDDWLDDMEMLAQVPGDTTTFTHEDLEELSHHWYCVRAINESGWAVTDPVLGRADTGQLAVNLVAVDGHGVAILFPDSSNIEDSYRISVLSQAPSTYEEIAMLDALEPPERTHSFVWYPTINTVTNNVYTPEGELSTKIQVQSYRGGVADDTEILDYQFPALPVVTAAPQITGITNNQGTVTVNWTNPPGYDGFSDTKLKVWRETLDTQQRIQVATLPEGTTSFIDDPESENGPPYDGDYLYWVEIYRSNTPGYSRWSLPYYIVTTGVVPAVTDLRVYSMAPGDVELRWTGSTNANHYKVYRSYQSGGFQFLENATVMGVYVDNTLPVGAVAFYRVTANTIGYESAVSNIAYVDTGGVLPPKRTSMQALTIPYQDGGPYNVLLCGWGEADWSVAGPSNKRIEVWAIQDAGDPWDSGDRIQVVNRPESYTNGAFVLWDDRFLPGTTWILRFVCISNDAPQPIPAEYDALNTYTLEIPAAAANDVSDLAVSYDQPTQRSTLTWSEPGVSYDNVRVYAGIGLYYDYDSLLMNEVATLDAGTTQVVLDNQPYDRHKRYIVIFWDADTDSEVARSNCVRVGQENG